MFDERTDNIVTRDIMNSPLLLYTILWARGHVRD